MTGKYNVLILGASYGSLFATKLAMACHSAHLVCLPEEVDLINSAGAIVKMPIRGREGSIDICTAELSGSVMACGPAHARPEEFDLVVFAMQEPQYRSSDLRDLLCRIGETARPCLSIMNMPPLPYLERIPGLDVDACRDSYADATVWNGLDSDLMTLCSPDPQAFRPPGLPINVLQVRLPTNFKAARFRSNEHTTMLRQLESDIQSARFELERELLEVPVKLRVHESIFVPMAKWCMLLAGNYRCIGKDEMRPIREAIRSDPKKSRDIYEWVSTLCISLGASKADMVPFDKYAQAAESLITPSSAARALAAGAPNIERVDRLVQTIAANRGLHLTAVDEIVSLVDYWLQQNSARSP